MFNVNIYERYFGQLEKVWWNIKGKELKNAQSEKIKIKINNK